MKILLGDFNAKVGREDIFKPTIGNESSHEISNDNGVRVVNFATSKNLVVKSIFGPKRDEVTGKWRKLHNEELHNLYSSPDNIRQIKSRRMRWAGHVARMGEKSKVYIQGLMGKPEGKRPLGRPRRRWEDGIRMDLREIGLGGVGWIRLAQYRDRWPAVVSAVMNLRVLAPRS
jgi:hypothetical protein